MFWCWISRLLHYRSGFNGRQTDSDQSRTSYHQDLQPEGIGRHAALNRTIQKSYWPKRDRHWTFGHICSGSWDRIFWWKANLEWQLRNHLAGSQSQRLGSGIFWGKSLIARSQSSMKVWSSLNKKKCYWLFVDQGSWVLLTLLNKPAYCRSDCGTSHWWCSWQHSTQTISTLLGPFVIPSPNRWSIRLPLIQSGLLALIFAIWSLSEEQ